MKEALCSLGWSVFYLAQNNHELGSIFFSSLMSFCAHNTVTLSDTVKQHCAHPYQQEYHVNIPSEGHKKKNWIPSLWTVLIWHRLVPVRQLVETESHTSWVATQETCQPLLRQCFPFGSIICNTVAFETEVTGASPWSIMKVTGV